MVILVCEVNCMYLRRKIDDYLKEWKNSEERKPLIIKGARQIGKTESIRKFAEENYTSVLWRSQSIVQLLWTDMGRMRL